MCVCVGLRVCVRVMKSFVIYVPALDLRTLLILCVTMLHYEGFYYSRLHNIYKNPSESGNVGACVLL